MKRQPTKIHGPFCIDVRTYHQEPDWLSPLKCHDFWELLLVLEGTMGVITRKKEDRAGPGSIYIRAPGVMHSEWCVSPKGVSVQVLAWKSPPKAAPTRLPAESFDSSGLVRTGLQWMAQLHARLPSRHVLLDRMLELLLFECANPPKTPLQENRFARLLTYIHEHLAQPLTSDDLAKIACLSRGHFNEEFRRETGFSPAAYVRKARIEHATREIMGTNTVLREIARQVGFRDEFEFSRVFRRTMGVAPSSLRTREKPGKQAAAR